MRMLLVVMLCLIPATASGITTIQGDNRALYRAFQLHKIRIDPYPIIWPKSRVVLPSQMIIIRDQDGNIIEAIELPPVFPYGRTMFARDQANKPRLPPH